VAEALIDGWGWGGEVAVGWCRGSSPVAIRPPTFSEVVSNPSLLAFLTSIIRDACSGVKHITTYC
jgi:hypothetical protein